MHQQSTILPSDARVELEGNVNNQTDLFLDVYDAILKQKQFQVN